MPCQIFGTTGKVSYPIALQILPLRYFERIISAALFCPILGIAFPISMPKTHFMWLYCGIFLLPLFGIATGGFLLGMLWHDAFRPFEGNRRANFHGFYCIGCRADYGAEGRSGSCPRCGKENLPLNF